MLQKLTISNFAIIKHLVFEPVHGLNIVTGETGAGKSIVLDALNLILGSRADIKTQSEWGEKCIIEGEFALNYEHYSNVFNELDIDFDAVTIIRREINVNGKTRTFINDTPVSLQQLRRLTDSLVSIHSQHENTQLNDKEFQFELLDAFAGNDKLIQNYQSSYKTYKLNENKLLDLRNQQSELLKEKDYVNFLLNEFETLALKENELESLESELQVLENAEQINAVCDQLIQTFTDSEQSIAISLVQIRNRFKSIANVHPSAAAISERIQSLTIELKDISDEAAHLRETVIVDANRLEIVNERINVIQNLMRKHAAVSYSDLFSIQEKLADQSFSIGNIDQKIEELKLVNNALHEKLMKDAKNMHQQRVKASKGLKTELETLLRSLEMPNASLGFELQELDVLNSHGISDLQIRFSANLGMPLQALNKVASGGELSRLALCIRSIEAKHKHLNTLVFDEIDTGVSGRVADTIGNLFRQISNAHQVIAITHLPQVAGYGSAHFMVCKKEENNTTMSYIKRLDQKERVEELAKMLSGNESTEIAKKNAKELLKA